MRTMLVFMLLLVSGNVFGDDLVIASARIAPSSTLPGLPFWVRFEVVNRSGRSQPLPRAYVVEVTPAGGKPFLVTFATNSMALLPDEDVTSAPLDTGQSRIVEFPTSREAALGDGVAGDPRLWIPDTYDLRFVLSDEIRSSDLARYRWHELQGAGRITKAPLVTPAIRLVVEEPAGADAKAWRVLSDPQNGAWMLMGPKTDEVSAEYWKEFAGSRYAPYIGLAYAESIARSAQADRFETAERIRAEAAVLDKDGVVAESVRLGRAFRLASRAGEATDIAVGLELLAKGREELAILAESAEHDWTRMRARKLLVALPTPALFEQRFAARHKAH